MWNVHIHTKVFIMRINIGIWKKKEISSGTKLLFTFLSLRFFDMRRERHNFLLCWLFHLTPPRAAPPLQTTGLASASTENRLNGLASNLNSVFFKFPNPQTITTRHDVIHIPGPISDLGFLLWHLWLSHPPHVRVNTCTQFVCLTNPCTKPKSSQPN